MSKQLKIKETVIQTALTAAKTGNKSIKFEFFHPQDNEKRGYCRSCAGTAYPCGCIEFTTILPDGSFGWGGWTQECNQCAWDN